MKTIACKDAGMDCKFVAKDETEGGVIAKAMDHVQKVHPDKAKEMSGMMSEEEMTNKVRSLIKEV